MKTKQAGFTLIELLVVVGIIVILAAISLPAILQFIRNYRINGAAQQVAGEVQAARTKAIMRNVNRGVLFLVMPDPNNPALFNRYQWVLPEQVAPVGGYVTLDQLQLLPAQAGPVKALPDGVTFVNAGTAPSVGFTRLGASCDPAAGCGIPVVAQGAAVLCPTCINFDPVAAQSTLTLTQEISGLTRTVTIMTGGRVLAQ